MIKVGDQAPLDINLVDMSGEKTSLQKFIGKYLVLYFYPKDDTPGCTTEACEFRDYNDEIEKLGAKIIGISKDNIKAHSHFKEKHDLNFVLLSDPEHLLQESFGVWVEKQMMGRKYMGTQRATFLINPTGMIVHVWENVKPIGHAKAVYDILIDVIKEQSKY